MVEKLFFMEIKNANINDNELHSKAMFNNGQLMLLDNLEATSSPLVIRNQMVIVMLVLDGHGTFALNEKSYKIEKNDIFIGQPNIILENCMTNYNFKCHCIAMSVDYMTKNFPVMDNTWDVMTMLSNNPVVSLSADEAHVFCQYYDLLCSKTHLPSIVQEKVINTLMTAFLYDLQHILDRVSSACSYPLTSKEVHFKTFIDLLQNTYPKNRLVSYYSDQMSISSKYLASICKKVVGESPSHIIDSFIMKDIEYLMKYTTKSIKEIAYELTFPNLSHFGKYMRIHFGMSPKDYRKKLANIK